jgi:hypothetical protein
VGCVKLELTGTVLPSEAATPRRPHFLYSRVKFGESLLKRLLNRDGMILTTLRPELIFHVYAENLEDTLGLVKDMRVMALEITSAANDLEAFAEGFDFTADPA